jgi:hypothetical protein
MMDRRIAVMLGALVTMANSAAAQARPAMNLNTHSEVVIDRPAATIWPLIVDPTSWKQGTKSWHYAGPAGQLGEVFAAGDPANRKNVEFFFENVQLVPNQRRTIKIYAPAGELLGFAIWTLREAGARTVVEYDVYSESLVNSVEARTKTPAELRDAERSYVTTNQQRFDRELLGLKRLVEAR